MRVRVQKYTGLSRPDGSRLPVGAELEVSDDEGARLVSMGHVVAIKAAAPLAEPEAPSAPIADRAPNRAYKRAKRK